MKKEPTDFEFIEISLENAYFSGLSFDQLMDCAIVSSNREELDAAIEVTIELNQITKGVDHER